MTESDYKYLQERLSKKSENNPYKHTGCTNYEYDFSITVSRTAGSALRTGCRTQIET